MTVSRNVRMLGVWITSLVSIFVVPLLFMSPMLWENHTKGITYVRAAVLKTTLDPIMGTSKNVLVTVAPAPREVIENSVCAGEVQVGDTVNILSQPTLTGYDSSTLRTAYIWFTVLMLIVTLSWIRRIAFLFFVGK